MDRGIDREYQSTLDCACVCLWYARSHLFLINSWVSQDSANFQLTVDQVLIELQPRCLSSTDWDVDRGIDREYQSTLDCACVCLWYAWSHLPVKCKFSVDNIVAYRQEYLRQNNMAKDECKIEANSNCFLPSSKNSSNGPGSGPVTIMDPCPCSINTRCCLWYSVSDVVLSHSPIGIYKGCHFWRHQIQELPHDLQHMFQSPEHGHHWWVC